MRRQKLTPVSDVIHSVCLCMRNHSLDLWGPAGRVQLLQSTKDAFILHIRSSEIDWGSMYTATLQPFKRQISYILWITISLLAVYHGLQSATLREEDLPTLDYSLNITFGISEALNLLNKRFTACQIGVKPEILAIVLSFTPSPEALVSCCYEIQGTQASLCICQE